MASDIALDIEIGARTAGAPFRTHLDILRAAPASTRLHKKPLKIPLTLDGVRTFIEPDALFSVHGRVFALEADKGTESIKAVIVPKILAYREIVAAGIIDDYLGVDNLRVLFATTSRKRMRNVMDELAKIARNGKSTMFGFRADDAFGRFPESAPYRRDACSALRGRGSAIPISSSPIRGASKRPPAIWPVALCLPAEAGRAASDC